MRKPTPSPMPATFMGQRGTGGNEEGRVYLAVRMARCSHNWEEYRKSLEAALDWCFRY